MSIGINTVTTNSRAESESTNMGLPFEINIEKLDLSLTNIQQDYPKSCLPSLFKKPSGTKARQLAYEQIDPKVYDTQARMVAFRIKRERLEPWIKALHILYYDHYGQTDPFTVKWYDEPTEWTDDENKTTCIDLMKNDQLLYKVTLFINTGVIQAQGNNNQTFSTTDFPTLKMLVNTICNSNDDTDSETEVKKIQTSHKSQNNNEKTECGPGCTNDSNTTLDTRAENSNSTLQHPKEITLL